MASRKALLPGQAPPGFPRSQALKFNSGAGTRSAPSELWARRAPRARFLPPRPPPAYFAAVAHSEEVVPQHLHGAGPGGVDKRPSEDVRQQWHPGGTHVSGRAQRGVRGPRGAHQAEARRRLPRLWAAAEPARAPAWSCPPSLFCRSPAPCRPRPGAGCLSFLYQWDFPPWSWLPAPVGVVFPSSAALVFDILTLLSFQNHGSRCRIRGGCHPPRGQEMKEGAGGVRVPVLDLELVTKSAFALCPPTSSTFL